MGMDDGDGDGDGDGKMAMATGDGDGMVVAIAMAMSIMGDACVAWNTEHCLGDGRWPMGGAAPGPSPQPALSSQLRHAIAVSLPTSHI